MDSIFIDISDGFTLSGYLAERKGLHPAISFTYRPALPDKVATYHREMGQGNGAQAVGLTVKLLVEHLRTWDAKDRAGNSVPISEAVLRRVLYPVLELLASHVTGYVASQREQDEGN